MISERIMYALGEINDEFIAECANIRMISIKAVRAVKRILSVGALAALLFLSILLLRDRFFFETGLSIDTYAMSEDKIIEDKSQEELDEHYLSIVTVDEIEGFLFSVDFPNSFLAFTYKSMNMEGVYFVGSKSDDVSFRSTNEFGGMKLSKKKIYYFCPITDGEIPESLTVPYLKGEITFLVHENENGYTIELYKMISYPEKNN